jgi:SecD/SecF fusion protein
VVAGSIEIIRHRIYELGFGEPVIERQGADRIMVKLAGVQDLRRLAGMLSETGRFTFRKVDQSVPVEEAIAGRAPAGSSLLYSMGDQPPPYLVEDHVIVSDDNIMDAQAIVDQRTNEPVVTFHMDSKGAQLFEQWTHENIGQMVAIIVDEQVISAPYVIEPILSGDGQIPGNFTMEGAKDVAAFLRAGALPARFNVIEIGTDAAAP